eukprot:scaffold24359_cov64-Phaeocystis_antarctica.AAC.2
MPRTDPCTFFFLPFSSYTRSIAPAHVSTKPSVPQTSTWTVFKARAPEAAGWRHPMAWALPVGVLSRQEPPGAPSGGAGAELGRCHDGCFPMLRAPACPRQAQP